MNLNVSPTPPSPESIIEEIRRWKNLLRPHTLRDVVFVYQSYMAEDQIISMSGFFFEDGKPRLVLHPKHRETVEDAVENEGV